MTLSRGSHGQRGRGAAAGLRRAAAAALIATALFASGWAGPAARASSSPRPGRSASPTTVTSGHTAPVPYYIVPVPGPGAAVTLFAIAAQTLGNGSRFPEIFSLNQGRLQPNGARLADPRVIDSGWILELPSGARGPGVRLGPLPVVQPAAPAAAPSAARTTRRPSTAVTAAARGSSLSILTALGVLLLIVALAVSAVLATRRPWRRLRRAAPWRPGRAPGPDPHVRERPGPRDAGRAGPGSGSGRAGPDPYSPGAKRPSLLGIDPFGALGPDHPSFPGAGGQLGTVGPAPWPGADPPGGPYPARRPSGRSPGWSRRPDQGTPGAGRHETALAPAPAPVLGPAPGPRGQHAAGLAQRVPRQAEAGFHADSLQVAERILAEADEQAMEIVTSAEQAAAELGQQAAAALTAAEQEAASLRAAVAEMTVELNRVAATVIEKLPAAVPPAASGTARSRRKAAHRTAQPQVKLGISPGAGRGPGRPRRASAARLTSFARWWPSRSESG
jgi:hypothetical protein